MITVLLPHYRTGKMTAYAVSQLKKHKCEIIVIDNGGGGYEYLDNISGIKILRYPEDRMQSHGIAFDFAIPHIKTDYFITVESDSFPTDPKWLDYYYDLIEKGFDCAGSLLNLSGGQYIHPAGALYRTKLVHEAMVYAKSIPYIYFPNIAVQVENGISHPFHLMVHKTFVDDFCNNASKAVNIHHSYEGLTPEQIRARATEYEPTCGVFHNGMGNRNEKLSTYGKRNLLEEPNHLLVDGKPLMISRVGYEPGQWFCYWLAANNYNIYPIPTDVVWMHGRVNQQQEYTLMENGFKHLWGVTAYNGCDISDLKDVISFKENQMNKLWESLNT